MNNPLRILHLCSAREYVGEAARVIDLVQTLVGRGHRADLIARSGYSVVEEARKRELPVLPANLESRCLPWRDIADILLIRKRILGMRPHALHAHRGKEHWLSAVALRTVKPETRPPLIRTRHVMMPINDHAANRWLYSKGTQGLICVSNAVRKSATDSAPYIACPTETICGGVMPERLAVPQSADVAEFRREHSIPEESLVVSCLARLAPVKGQLHLIEAIPDILRECPGTVFCFAFQRSSDYRKLLDERVRALGIEKSIRWIGKIDRLAPLMGATDVGALCSTGSEGWSRAGAEFMYYGVPLVATDVGCLSELVRDGTDGLIVPPRASALLAGAIVKLLNDSNLRRKFGTEGRDRIAEQYTYARVADEAVAFYRRIVEADEKAKAARTQAKEPA